MVPAVTTCMYSWKVFVLAVRSEPRFESAEKCSVKKVKVIPVQAVEAIRVARG
jgi:hypothetical protein